MHERLQADVLRSYGWLRADYCVLQAIVTAMTATLAATKAPMPVTRQDIAQLYHSLP